MAVEQDVLVRLLLAQRAMLLGYIESLVRDAHLAEDVFQDVTLIALRKRDDLLDAAGFSVWARKIARLEALNALRKRSKAPRILDQSVLDVLDRHWAGSDEGDSPGALRDCLKRLSPRSRQLVDLKYRDALSGQQLSERLSQPLNTIYVSLARIHKALSVCLKSTLGTEGARHG